MKVLYFDTETTGLDPKRQDIIQIAGIIEIDGNIEEEFMFTCQPFSYENISPAALNVHGYTEEDLKKFESPQKMYIDLKKIFSKYIDKYNRNDKFVPAGQNVKFDIDFLSEFFKKNDDQYFGSWMQWQSIDLLSLTTILKYLGKIDVANFKLETIADAFGIKFNAHDALEDIRTTRILIKKIISDHIK